MIVYNYSWKEENKLISEEIIDWTIKTTYIWNAKWEKYNSTDDYANPIWSITKLVEDTSTWIFIKYRPNKSSDFSFVRDDRASLTYV